MGSNSAHWFCFLSLLNPDPVSLIYRLFFFSSWLLTLVGAGWGDMIPFIMILGEVLAAWTPIPLLCLEGNRCGVVQGLGTVNARWEGSRALSLLWAQ